MRGINTGKSLLAAYSRGITSIVTGTTCAQSQMSEQSIHLLYPLALHRHLCTLIEMTPHISLLNTSRFQPNGGPCRCLCHNPSMIGLLGKMMLYLQHHHATSQFH